MVYDFLQQIGRPETKDDGSVVKTTTPRGFCYSRCAKFIQKVALRDDDVRGMPAGENASSMLAGSSFPKTDQA
jgi:hypothetical protein